MANDTNCDGVNVKSLKINGETAVSVEMQADVVAPLTEASGAIGGTNNSDIPDQTATVGAAVTATVGADLGAFTNPPSVGEMAALRTFVNALKADQATIILVLNIY